jgi:hypothetical protein
MREGEHVAVSWPEWRWAVVAALLVVALAGLPYCIAWLRCPPDAVYTGLLFNPFDGHSYLAKMRQGANGEWLFRLPFTPEEQRRTFLFGYYLLLGHIARWFGLPLTAVYHTARSVNSFGLLLIGYRFAAEFIADLSGRRLAFLFFALSSGLSWATVGFGLVGLDMQLIETNTFFSMLSNPHFPLAGALALLVFLSVASPLSQLETSCVQGRKSGMSGSTIQRAMLACGASVGLAIVFPFMVIVVYAVLLVFLTARSAASRRWPSADWARAIMGGFLSGAFLIYYWLVTQHDPSIAAWRVQAYHALVTASLWQTLLGYGLLVPLAMIGAGWGLRWRRAAFLVIWVVVALGLVYAPLGLQLRLLLGLHIAVAVLAALGAVCALRLTARRWRRFVLAIIVATLVPTNLMMVLFHLSDGVPGARWPLFMTEGEAAAFAWLRDSVPPGELVLASPQMGLMIPAWAGQRVMCGHAVETVDAVQRKAEVEGFFAGTTDWAEFLRKYDVRYIFVGRKERELGDVGIIQSQTRFPLDVSYTNDEVTIYRVSTLAGEAR